MGSGTTSATPRLNQKDAAHRLSTTLFRDADRSSALRVAVLPQPPGCRWRLRAFERGAVRPGSSLSWVVAGLKDCENFFEVVFLVEAILKSAGLRLRCWRNKWNWVAAPLSSSRRSTSGSGDVSRLRFSNRGPGFPTLWSHLSSQYSNRNHYASFWHVASFWHIIWSGFRVRRSQNVDHLLHCVAWWFRLIVCVG